MPQKKKKKSSAFGAEWSAVRGGIGTDTEQHRAHRKTPLGPCDSVALFLERRARDYAGKIRFPGSSKGAESFDIKTIRSRQVPLGQQGKIKALSSEKQVRDSVLLCPGQKDSLP